MKSRLAGAPEAITAAAHKLARIIYMLRQSPKWAEKGLAVGRFRTIWGPSPTGICAVEAHPISPLHGHNRRTLAGTATDGSLFAGSASGLMTGVGYDGYVRRTASRWKADFRRRAPNLTAFCRARKAACTAPQQAPPDSEMNSDLRSPETTRSAGSVRDRRRWRGGPGGSRRRPPWRQPALPQRRG
jgi:hypothetical protein